MANEGIKTWLEQVDQLGPAIPLDKFENLLETAPRRVKETKEYQYFRGLFDGRLIHEELGGI